MVKHCVQDYLADSHIHLSGLPAGGYVFEVSVTLGYTHHLSLGFEPVVESVPVCVPSFFVQLISSVADSVLQFSEPYLPEIVVGRTQLKLHDFRSFLVVSVGTQGDARLRFLPSTPLTLRWIESGFNARQWGKAFGEIPVHGYSASRN